MIEEVDQGVKSVVVEAEHRSDGGLSFTTRNRGFLCLVVHLFLDHSAVLTTGNELPSGSDLSSRGRKN